MFPAGRIVLLSVLALFLGGIATPLFAAGISAAFDSCGVGTSEPTSRDTVDFHPYKVPQFKSLFANRDLEFHWSDNYATLFGRPLNVPRAGSTDTDLDLLGINICATPGTGAFGFPIPFIQLMYDYLRAPGLGRHTSVDNYNTDASATMGFNIGDVGTTYGDLDRNHIDTYVYAPKFSGDPLWQDGGDYPGDGGAPLSSSPSAYRDEEEDVSTGHPADIDTANFYRFNSVGIPGPTPSQVGVAGANDWTQARKLAALVFNHEFQHAVNTVNEDRKRTEIFSHVAEALTGEHPEVPAFDVPYTWGLLRPGLNYQAYRSFSAYLTYNFRGVDTTFAGRGDDLVWRWARSADRFLVTGLGQQLLTVNCAECTTKTYFNGLSATDRVNLLVHNWRVANYVNKPSLAEGQYGFAPQFGFEPNIDVGNWQDIDPGAVDTVNIEMEVKLDRTHLTRDLSLAGTPTNVLNPTNAHAMALSEFGSEYWVVRSDSSLWSANRDLVVRIMPEGRTGDLRLYASAVAYNEQNLGGGQPDSLWNHPEWAQTVIAPKRIDLGPGADPDPLEVVVPNFGQTHKAALIVISTGLDSDAGRDDYVIPYRLNLALRVAPFQSPNPVQVTTFSSPYSGAHPSWSPAGDEIAFVRADATIGPVDQVYRAPVAGGTPTILFAQPYDQFYPDWSPRGDWVSFDQASNTGLCDVWMVSPATGQSRQLTSSADHEYAAVFSPNGQQLVYLRQLPAGRVQLRRVNVDGGNDTLLWDRTAVVVPPLRWDANGPRVFFRLRSGSPPVDSLFAIDALGPERGSVTPNSAQLPTQGATFDPPRGSGRWVWESTWQPLVSGGPPFNGATFQRVALRDTPTGANETIFSRPSSNLGYPRWSPDGTRVAFTASRPSPATPANIFVGQVSYNHAPQFPAGLADLVVHTGRPFGMLVGATDSDGEALTYQAPSVFLPNGSSFTPATGTFSWPSPGPVCSEHFVVFRALDGSGGVASRVVRFTAAIDSVADLNAELVGDTEAWLTWTAPGDNGALGRGVEYELRYAQVPLTESTFPLGTRVTGMPAPAVPGTAELQQATGLSPGTTYYFAIRTQDAKGNWSILSNVVQVTTTSGGGSGEYSARQVQAPLAGARSAQTALSRPGLGGASGALAVEMALENSAPLWSIRQLDADEMIALGAGDTTGVLLQARDGAGAWHDRGRIPAKLAAWRFGVRALRQPGRIVFLGGYGVRQAWESVELDGRSGAARLLSAAHSRLGDVKGGFDSTGTARLEVGTADTLSMRYELLTADSETAQDWFLLVGPPGSEVSTPVKRRPGVSETVLLPTAFALRQNQPNPFLGRTAIRFELPIEARVRLDIFDAQGRLVRTLADGGYPAGVHALEWDHRTDGGQSLGAGIYLYRIQAGTFRDQKKMVLLGR